MQTKNKTNTQKIKLLKKTLKQKDLDKREFIRTQAVLFRLQGFSRKQIADMTGKSISSIEDWITLFNKKGIKGLKSKKTKKPNNFKLSPEQKQEIKKSITKKTPNQLGIQGSFWNRNLLEKLVWKKFKIRYKSKTSYHKLMKYCGFTYQKVQERDSRQNKQDQEHFKTRLKKRTKKGVLTISW